MNKAILEKLRGITKEEQDILDGTHQINKDLYMDSSSDIVDNKKLLEYGKLIQVRTHTRFIHFPRHKHNYVEVIYMCKGHTRHIINGEEVDLKEGELLFLNQNVIQEIYPAQTPDYKFS